MYRMHLRSPILDKVIPMGTLLRWFLAVLTLPMLCFFVYLLMVKPPSVIWTIVTIAFIFYFTLNFAYLTMHQIWSRAAMIGSENVAKRPSWIRRLWLDAKEADFRKWVYRETPLQRGLARFWIVLSAGWVVHSLWWIGAHCESGYEAYYCTSGTFHIEHASLDTFDILGYVLTTPLAMLFVTAALYWVIRGFQSEQEAR
jgi:hypothetical protein